MFHDEMGYYMIKQSLVLMLIASSIYLSGGSNAFAPFLHIEAILLVFGGTFLLTWAVYSVKELLTPTALQYASRCAIGLGMITTVLDFMVHLLFELETADLVRKFSPSLAGLFYGLLLSKIIIAPMAERAGHRTKSI